MLDFEIKQLNKRKREESWIKNTKLLNWKFKISWIQNTITFASNLLFFEIDLFWNKKSRFVYKNNLLYNIICFNISLMKNTWNSLVESIKIIENFLIQHCVSFTMFRKLITFLFLNDISLWRMKNKSINEKRKNVFWRFYSL